jgi:hypothetical protein
MKKTILVTSLTLLLATAPAIAQMMGSGSGSGVMGGQDDRSTQQMMEQQQMQQTAPTGGQNYPPQYMTPGMMGTYGCGMGQQMMGGVYGYGMGPSMMGGYGYGMHPGMMMGGYGYGMGPAMMGGHGFSGHPGMMGFHSLEQYEEHFKEHQKFLDETHDLRKKLHALKFDFAEAQRNPDTRRENLEKINGEMENFWKQIYEKKKATFK